MNRIGYSEDFLTRLDVVAEELNNKGLRASLDKEAIVPLVVAVKNLTAIAKHLFESQFALRCEF